MQSMKIICMYVDAYCTVSQFYLNAELNTLSEMGNNKILKFPTEQCVFNERPCASVKFKNSWKIYTRGDFS